MEEVNTVNATVEKDMEVSTIDKVIVIDSDKLNEVNNGEKASEEVIKEDEEMEPPNMGMVFNNPEEVRCYYDEYAWRLGFSTIKKSTKSGDDGNVKYFTLACSRSGKELTSGSKTNRVNFRKRLPPRTNCKAKMNVTIGPDGRVYVCRVVLEHNHELVPGIQGRRIMRARVPRAKRVGTGPGQSIVHEAGYSENLTSDSATVRVAGPNQTATARSHRRCSATHSVNGNMSKGSKRRCPASADSQLSQGAIDRTLAKKAVEFVKSGMVIGLGSGSAISLVIEELGRLIKEGKLKDILTVGANYQSQVLARQYGITIVDMNIISNIDVAFDGVDEVDFNKNLLKCGGPAHTMQKVIDSMANECIVLADHPKVVHRLGSAFPVPVEVLPPALTHVLKRLATLGGVSEIRSASTEGSPLFTDLGNMVVDVSFPDGIQNPAELEKSIKMIPGVVESGIVTGVATTVLVAVKENGTVNVMNLEDYVKIVLERRDASVAS